MLNWLALEPPMQDEFYMPLVLPTLFSIIAAAMYLSAINRERRGQTARWKWYSLIPAALGIFFGFNPTYAYATDSFYREIAQGNKMMVSHIASLGLPVLTFLGILGFEYFWRIQKARYQ